MPTTLQWILLGAGSLVAGGLGLIARRSLIELQRDLRRTNWILVETIYQLRDELAGDDLIH